MRLLAILRRVPALCLAVLLVASIAPIAGAQSPSPSIPPAAAARHATAARSSSPARSHAWAQAEPAPSPCDPAQVLLGCPDGTSPPSPCDPAQVMLGCGDSTPAPAPTEGPTVPGSGSSLAVTAPPPIDPGSMTAAEVDQAFNDQRQRLREQAGLIDALGSAGPEIYASIDSSKVATGQDAAGGALGQTIGRTAYASVAGSDHVDVPSWSEAVPTSFMVGLIGGIYSQFGSSRSDTGSISLPTDRQTFTSESGGIKQSTNIVLDVTHAFDGNNQKGTISMSYTTTLKDLATGAITDGPTGTDSMILELQGCPDSNGMVIGRVKAMTTEGSADPTLGGPAYRSTTEYNVHVFVGEDAWRIREESATQSDLSVQGPIQQLGQAADARNDWEVHFGYTDTKTTTGDPGAGKWAFDDAASQKTFSSDFREVSDAGAAKATIAGSNIMGLLMTRMPAMFGLDSAEQFWRGGNCVEVLVLEGQGGDVDEGQSVHIVAQPRHKVDKVDLSKPVVATLEGVRSVAPVGVAVPAPAAFDYTAGDQENRVGTVTLTSTSNRGIGKTSLVFVVRRKETPAPSATVDPSMPPGAWRGYVKIEYAKYASDSSKTDYGAGSYISNAHEESTTITDTYELESGRVGGAGGPATAQVPLMGQEALAGQMSVTDTVLTVSLGAVQDPGHPKRMIGCDYDKSSVRHQEGGWDLAGEASGMLSLMADGTYQITVSSGAFEGVSVPGTEVQTYAPHRGIDCSPESSSTTTFSTDPSSSATQWLSPDGIRGQIDPADPGDTISGSTTTQGADGSILTVSWGFVHDGPITFP